MRAFLHKVFIEDAPLKVLSLVLSVILFLVRSDWDASTPAYVRINYIEPAGRVITSDLTTEAKVSIRGPWSRASRYSETELDPITIDLSKREDGELRFTEDLVRLPPGLRVGTFNPPSVTLTFEPRIEKELPVQPVIEGEPAEGYRLGKVSVMPKTIKVTGAKGAIEGMRNAQTRPVRVTDLKGPVGLTAKLAPAPHHVRFAESPEIAVHIEIERTIVERTYSNVQITVTGSSHLADIQLQPEVATVVLRGPALALEQLKGTPEVVVDAATEDHKVPGTYRKRLQVVNLPPDLAAEIRPEAVHLIIAKREAPR